MYNNESKRALLHYSEDIFSGLVWIVGLLFCICNVANYYFVSIWTGANYFVGYTVNFLVSLQLFTAIVSTIFLNLCTAVGQIRAASVLSVCLRYSVHQVRHHIDLLLRRSGHYRSVNFFCFCYDILVSSILLFQGDRSKET